MTNAFSRQERARPSRAGSSRAIHGYSIHPYKGDCLRTDTAICPDYLREAMAERQDVVTDERMDKYLDITGRALAKLRIAAPEKSYNRRLADSFLEMANCYYSDAKHFRECGDLVTAFAAVNYAHAWLDCGARIGLFDVGGDDVLFTLFERSPRDGSRST